jgi:hypothetical protein
MGSIESFREQVKTWLADNCADDLRGRQRDGLSRKRYDEWVRLLGSQGWAAPGWPLRVAWVVVLALLSVGCTGGLGQSNSDPEDTTVVPAGTTVGGAPPLLSAFFGLDDGLPVLAQFLICGGARGGDGMPVVFSQELDIESVQAGDFRVVLSDGRQGEVDCVTPAPANEIGEFRTILMIGDFGSAAHQPVRVEVAGNILSEDGRSNFRGAQVDVVRLERGPSLVMAEIVPPEEWEIGKSATRFPFGGGSGCPDSTRQVVRVVWNGGVTKPGGGDIDDFERAGYTVFLGGEGDGPAEVTPFAVGDLGDGDNNHELCLDTERPPIRVAFPAGLVTDPREDLNPATEVAVSR